MLASSIVLAGWLMVGSSWGADAPAGEVKGSADAGTHKHKNISKGTRATPLAGAQERRAGGKKVRTDVAAAPAKVDEIALLKEQLAQQQKQIEQLRAAMAEQKQLLERALRGLDSSPRMADAPGPTLGEVASFRPVIPGSSPRAGVTALPGGGRPQGMSEAEMELVKGQLEAVADSAAQTNVRVTKLETDLKDTSKKADGLGLQLGGFKFSGDFRLRSDNVLRSANSVAGAQQNVRARYRLRFNIDKVVSDKIDTHVQLGSGTFNNPLTFDTDMAGVNTRGAIFLTEAWGSYHPNKQWDFRGGKMAEVFADNEQFVLDDDVRFNGSQQIAKVPFETSSLGKVTFELRAGQYILTNPNVQGLPTASQCASASPPANCAFVTAGFAPGQKVRSTNLFDQGFVISTSGQHWSQQFASNFQLWRNPNSLQLATTSAGYPLLVNGYYGVALSGGISGSGNATTTKGGAILTAAHWQVGRLSYRIDYKGLKSSRQNFPVYFLVQGARNFGIGFYNNAFEGALNIGETKKFGDVLLKYAFYYKQANSMISQVTDDDVGTGTGVNLKTHAIRFDLGLNKFMVWQNRIYIQNELAGNQPARSFFVPVVWGTGTQYRYQSQLQFNF